MKYRREIDGLRAVAVLPVIFFHAGFSLFGGGFVGVDVFFVISGYLISSILIVELEQGRFSIVKFYERRARRILPALFFVMLVCLPFAYAWMLPLDLKDFSESLVAVVVFASNVLFWREDGYFAAAAEQKPLLHTWSLAVEEQFYLLFPLLLMLLWRYGRKRVLWSVIGFAGVSFALAEWGWRNEPNASFYLAPTRAWELLAGSICAFLTVGSPQRSNNFLSTSGLIMIVFAIFVYDSRTPSPSLYTSVPVVGTVLVILFAGPVTLVARLLSLRGFVAIGLISYSAYLWHQPLFAFARLRSIVEPSYGLMGLLVFASFLLAWGTWYWIERPFRRGSISLLLTQRNVFLFGGMAGIVFVVIGLFGHLSNGLPSRLSIVEQSLYSTAISSPMRSRCHYEPTSDFRVMESCEYFQGNADVAVYGNSHGVELAYALAEELQSKSRSIAHFTVSGCEPGFQRKISAYCDDFYIDRLRYLLENERLQYVVLTYRAEWLDADGVFSIINLANFLVESSKRVILVLQAPTLEREISSYFLEAFSTGAENVEARSRVNWEEVNAAVYGSLADLNPSVQVLDLADYFCDRVTCFAVRDNEALYFDNNHMSVFGARRVAAGLARLLDK